MGKQEIIDKYWLEFLSFWKLLNKEAKEEEVEFGFGDKFDFGKMFELMGDSEKLVKAAILEQFKEPTEATFWKWYAIYKMDKITKKDKQ